ncbi:MAG: hypothetical protein AAFX62_14025 [Pseudomonadota bacterium]
MTSAAEVLKLAEAGVKAVSNVHKVTKGGIAFDDAFFSHIGEGTDYGKALEWTGGTQKVGPFTILSQRMIAGKRHGLYVAWDYSFEYGGHHPVTPDMREVRNFRVNPHQSSFDSSFHWYCTAKVKKVGYDYTGKGENRIARMRVQIDLEAGHKLAPGKKQKRTWVIEARGDGKHSVS